MERPAIIATEYPPASSSRGTVYSRTLQRACEVLGGTEKLAQHLRVPASTLTPWLDGSEQPPLNVFLAAVDIVLLGAERGRGSA